MTITGPAITRLILLGFVASLLQLTSASQVSIFGVPMDLSPLIVASVGFLAGSVPGMIFGFCFGLFADTALMQTLGVTSLVLTVIGYGAGRIRELRDPAHGLAPLAVGAAAIAFATIGFASMQFLLGVRAPISWLLLRQVVVTILVGSLMALPIYALVRRVVQGSLPDNPRRRRRRAYTTGGLSPLQRPSAGR